MIRAIVEQHAEEAAFLGLLRGVLVEAPHVRLGDLARIDRRLEAHFDGLEIAGAGGIEISLRALPGEEGEVFAATVAAGHAGDWAPVLDRLVEGAPEAVARGVGAALSWLPLAIAGPAIALLSSSSSPAARGGALLASAAHRHDPGWALDAALLDENALLRAMALRAIGVRGRRDRIAALSASVTADESACRYWAAWSSSLLGDPVGAVVLREIARGGGAHAEAAAVHAALALPADEALPFVEALFGEEDGRRAARAAAAFGDPSVVPWLLEWLDEPALARIAGDALTAITGVAIEGELAGDAPEGFVAGPSDDPDDDDVTPDPDAHLPWPNVAAARDAFGRRELPGRGRHLMGRPLSSESLGVALRDGRQPERARAAFELARRGQPLFDVAAPFPRQRRALAARGEA